LLEAVSLAYQDSEDSEEMDAGTGRYNPGIRDRGQSLLGSETAIQKMGSRHCCRFPTFSRRFATFSLWLLKTLGTFSLWLFLAND
jgi:hypothetical protein